MNQDKKHSLEEMYAEAAEISGAELPEDKTVGIGQPVKRSKWPVVILIIIIFLIIIIAALLAGFAIFL